MRSVVFRFILVLGMVGSLFAATTQPSAAEAYRRWLAEPTLLANGNQAAAVDVAVIDASHVWASADRKILFFDGTTWTTQFEAPEPLVGLEMHTISTGWAVTRNATYAFDGTIWRLANDTQRHFEALFMSGDGTLLANVWNGISGSNGHTFLVAFDDTTWNQLSVPALRGNFGPRVQIAPDGSTWIWGNQRSLDSAGPITPFLFRYTQGNLTQINLPMTDTSIGVVSMRDENQGVILFHSDSNQKLSYTYNAGTWNQIEFPLPADIANSPTTLSYSLDFVASNKDETIVSLPYIGESACERTVVYRYSNGAWSIIDDNRAPLIGTLSPDGSLGWFSERVCLPAGNFEMQRYRYRNGTFQRDDLGSRLSVERFIILNENVQWGVGAGTIFRYAESTVPTERVDPLGPAHYFHETGHNVSGAFWDYYRAHGLDFGEPNISMAESLALFGLPLTEPFYELNPDLGEMVLVQYFERARMEYHPDNPPEYQVLLGRMGAVRYIQAFNLITNGNPNAPLAPDCERIEQTQHDLCPPFREYWRSVGSPQIFGWPIAYTQQQQSITDGNTYLTLWTERQRLEHHEALAGTNYEILLGLLGKEDLQVRGLLE